VPAHELEVVREDHGGVPVIRVRGSVDHLHYWKLEEAIQTELDRKQLSLVVDLSALDYISSAGINTLGHATSQYDRVGGRLCLVRPAETAQWHFFTTLGVDQIFSWAATLDDALARVRGPKAP
jgi:anti-anti-sigma factor